MHVERPHLGCLVVLGQVVVYQHSVIQCACACACACVAPEFIVANTIAGVFIWL